MLSKYDLILGQSLVTALVVSVALGSNPGCSAAAILALLAFRVADKYFHDSFHDANHSEIGLLKAELEKVKSKQSQLELRGALGGSRNA